MTDPLYVLGFLTLLVALSEVLVRHTALRHLGTALLVIVLAAVAVNVGLIPAVSEGRPVPVYDGLLGPVAKLAIFWLLLGVNLGEIRRAGGPMVAVFALGSVGTLAGVLLAHRIFGGAAGFGEHGPALAAMYVGTYTGGSINFNAMAEHYGVLREGGVYTAAAVVDSSMTALWMALTLLVPRLLGVRAVAREGRAVPESASDTETLEPLDLAWLVALGAAAVWGSERVAAALSIPSILVITTVALVVSHTPLRSRLAGTRLLGMFAVYLFLAAVGAQCDLAALRAAGSLGLLLFQYVAVTLAVHGTLVFGVALVARVPPEVAAIASQANVGGSTSALALARSLGRGDLVLPAILVGALGNALGNYLGVLAAGILG